jgi:hypothetical protein
MKNEIKYQVQEKACSYRLSDSIVMTNKEIYVSQRIWAFQWILQIIAG